VYAFQNLVDIFGMVPYYRSAGHRKCSSAYEDGHTVYADLFKRLDAAIATLNPEFGVSILPICITAEMWVLDQICNTLNKNGITIAELMQHWQNGGGNSRTGKLFLQRGRLPDALHAVISEFQSDL